MYYSVCASSVFSDVKLPDALPLVKQAGASAFEFWTWWDQDLDALCAAVEKTGLRTAAMCTYFIPLNVPSKRDEYVQGVIESVEAAKRLGCKTLISQVGPDQKDISRTAQHLSIVDGLRKCAPIVEKEDITLVLEPLNTYVDHPGYYLSSSQEAFEIVDEVASSHVKVLYDIYHQQIMEGNIIANLSRNIDKIGHIHAAGNPGRHELLTDSEVNYPVVFNALKKMGYQGAVGLEYFPVNDPFTGLKEILDQLNP